MKIRNIALALALVFGVTGMAEAKKRPPVIKHKSSKLRTKKFNAKKSNKQAAKALAKRRKHAA
jgi:hypothetical protein